MTSQSRVQSGVPAGGQFTTGAKGENPDLSGARKKPQPCYGIAIAYQGGKETSVDITRSLSNLSPAEHETLYRLVRMRHDRYSDRECEPTNQLTQLAREMGDIPHDSGLEVTPSEIIAWLDENPAWVEDGVTPHPTGGYVKRQSGFDYEVFFDQNGDAHREDGPASRFAYEGGFEFRWMIHGRPHREDGLPAVVTPDGSREWWVDGERQAIFVADVDGVDLRKLRMD